MEPLKELSEVPIKGLSYYQTKVEQCLDLTPQTSEVSALNID